MQSLAEIKTGKDLLKYLASDVNELGNLSIRGVAKLAGVDHKSIISGGDFKSNKLSQKLKAQGFAAGDLVKAGFCPESVILVLEYFAYDSKATAEGAKTILRTFGVMGLMVTLKELLQTQSAIAPAVKPEYPDIATGTLECIGMLAQGVKEAYQSTMAKLDRIENTTVSVGIDVKGEIRENIHEISESIKELSAKVDAVTTRAESTSRNSKAITFHCETEEEYQEFLRLAEISGMSRSKFFLEVNRKALGVTCGSEE